MPNQTLARGVITNYDLPESRMALLIPLSVGYDADPERVEAIARAERWTRPPRSRGSS